MIHLFHDWTAWEKYDVPRYVIENEITRTVRVEIRQRRKCKVCGKWQDMLVTIW